jgi:hypothetical protein
MANLGFAKETPSFLNTNRSMVNRSIPILNNRNASVWFVLIQKKWDICPSCEPSMIP